MKKAGLLIVLLGFALWTPTVSQVDAQETTAKASAFDQGVAAYNRGDYEAAKGQFQKVLQAVPNHPQSMRYLALIRNAERRELLKPSMEKSLDRIRIPKVEMEETAFEDVVDYIRRKTKEISGGKVSPNIIMRVPPEKAAEPVTMQLEQVPVSELLRYLTSITQTTAKYEPYAIVISPRSAASSQVRTPVKSTSRSRLPFEKEPEKDPFGR
ncbi:MAG: hypothetical protein AAGA58_07515 [Verrucomicrobiota bacterium]